MAVRSSDWLADDIVGAAIEFTEGFGVIPMPEGFVNAARIVSASAPEGSEGKRHAAALILAAEVKRLRGITEYHKCSEKGCETMLSNGSPSMCPACQSANAEADPRAQQNNESKGN